jgi:RNA polymerase sigma-70 factor (ECF subfamily)
MSDSSPAAVASPQDLRLVEALRGGDERAFTLLIEMYSGAMLRVALMYVPSRAVAEEVVQEAWLAVLEGIHRFEGRSSLKTWIFRIVMNRAITRGLRERRSVPFSALVDPAADPDEPAVDPSRFRGRDQPNAGHWASPPRSWESVPEDRLLAGETLDHLRRAIDGLPDSQRKVVVLRDVLGLTSQEACNVLGLTETNQRVLLHRGRSKVRRALEGYLEEGAADTAARRA